MTIEQTIDIPASRHVTFDLPFTFPIGKTKVALTVTFEGETAQGDWIAAQPVKPLRSLRGIDKGRDTMEAYFQRHHADNDRERETDRQRREP
ncbi:hypothetical protein AGMMS49579_27110 [Spirochaetia bacterium]|nr:hypothetical protein AGMMS49579_27110 [Spirochaetia bacterium]